MIQRVQQAIETYKQVVDTSDPHIHEPIDYEFGPEEFPDLITRGAMNAMWGLLTRADRAATRWHAAVMAGQVLFGQLPHEGGPDQE